MTVSGGETRSIADTTCQSRASRTAATAALFVLAGCSAPVTPGPSAVLGEGQGTTVASRHLSGKAGHKARAPYSRASRDLRRHPLTHNWYGVARCESNDQPHINTGNGYYGYLQESLSFWRSFGGLRFAPRPDLASRFEQTVVAERGLAVQGPGAWPVCSRFLLTSPAVVNPSESSRSQTVDNRRLDVPWAGVVSHTSICTACGALVTDIEAHDNWHDSIDQRIRRAWMPPRYA